MRVSHGDDGFTLVESILSIAILGIIMVPLSGLALTYFRNVDTTNARLRETHDAQTAASYFAQDVASIGVRSTSVLPALTQSVETNVSYNAGLFPCGSAGTPDAVVRFAWDDFPTASALATQIRVAYVVKTVGAETQLRRISCSGSSAVVTDTILAHTLIPGSQPTVTCSSACTGVGVNVPLTITLRVTLQDQTSRAAAYVVTLTGQRRQT